MVLIHNDIDTPFSKEGEPPAYAAQIKAVFMRHPKTTFIWAHMGVGRVVRPVKDQAAIIEEILKDPRFNHVYMDISWDEVAKYLVSTPAEAKATADLINRYPNRFLFGTDEVAPATQEKYEKVFINTSRCGICWIKPPARRYANGNYERIFDEARVKVRAWEKTHVGGPGPR